MGQTSGVGMPAYIHLEMFGYMIESAFGECGYLVGSATTTNTPRDIDVRVLLDDAAFDAMFPGPLRQRHNQKWAAMCAAFSALGEKMTGLPIDFQIQRQSDANEKYKEGLREPLGIGFRIARYE